MDYLTALVLLHLAVTWTLVGLIWFVQLVHYPMFALQPQEGFETFAQEHQRRISWLVIPTMLVEAASSLLLLVVPIASPSRSLSFVWTSSGVFLLIVIWLSTFLLQVPCHTRLLSGKDSASIRILVKSNWIRTVSWTLRGVVAIRLLLEIL